MRGDLSPGKDGISININKKINEHNIVDIQACILNNILSKVLYQNLLK